MASSSSSSSRSAAAVSTASSSALSQFVATVRTNRVSLQASAVARGVSVLAMYPLDTLKSRVQHASLSSLPPLDALRAALTRGSLFSGVLSTMVGQIPYGALTFGSYEVYKDVLRERIRSRKLRWAVAAVLGDLTGSLWLTPSEVIKQQLQTAAAGGGGAVNGAPANVAEAIARVWRRKGPRGFYQGYSGQVARDVPFRAIQLLTFEECRERYARARGNRALTPAENLAIGALVGTVTAAVTNPLDVIKTRLMTSSGDEYRNAVHAMWHVLRHEPMALTRGMVPRVVYIAPSSAIFFLVYTTLQRRLRARQAQQRRRE